MGMPVLDRYVRVDQLLAIRRFTDQCNIGDGHIGRINLKIVAASDGAPGYPLSVGIWSNSSFAAASRSIVRAILAGFRIAHKKRPIALIRISSLGVTH